MTPPGTIQHCKENGVEIVNPKKTFIQLIEQSGMPTRFVRHCCGTLKEYKIHDRAIQGIRACESAKRAMRYREPEYCRVYSKKEKVKIYLPILYWSDEMMEVFIEEHGIKCHPLYYDEDGNFHVERRLGCIGCPQASDGGKSKLLKYPKMLKSFIRAQQKYYDSHPNSGITLGRNPYNAYFFQLFPCHCMAEFNKYTKDGIFNLDTKQWLEDTFNVDLTI